MYTCSLDLYLFDRFFFMRHLLSVALISGAILASPNLLADVPPATATLNTHKSPAPELVSPAQQEKFPEIEILEHDSVYHINLVTTINASARHVRYVLTDFIHIYRLNPSIIESDVLKRHDDGSVSVRTRVLGCAAYFCEELDRVERVHALPSGDLFAEIVPELSQFKSGQTVWRITPTGDEQCEVSYSAKLEPDIFIPPIVGGMMLKKSIREEMQISFANLEKISKVVAEKEWQENYQPEHTEFVAQEPCVNYVQNSINVAH